jgi:hypothetical protein
MVENHVQDVVWKIEETHLAGQPLHPLGIIKDDLTSNEKTVLLFNEKIFLLAV